MTIARERLHLGNAAVLTPTRAAELLPWGEAAALAWLRDRGLVLTVPGRGDVVIWGDVVAELRRAASEVAPAPEPARPRVREGRRGGI